MQVFETSDSACRKKLREISYVSSTLFNYACLQLAETKNQGINKNHLGSDWQFRNLLKRLYCMCHALVVPNHSVFCSQNGAKLVRGEKLEITFN